MIEIKINNKTVQVEEGKTILDAAKQEGINIPTLCHHPSLDPYASCRVCMVKINDGRKDRWVTSCNYPVRKPIEVFTNTEEVEKQRGGVIGMLLSRYPNVPVIKDLAEEYKVDSNGRTHPLVDYNPNACILCGMCVKVCKEGIWESVIGYEGRGADRQVTMPFGQHSEICLGCAACADICPTGAIDLARRPKQSC
jgi:NADH dehydrogenase/NADH:ubiquinone oxidoreductase subunit G